MDEKMKSEIKVITAGIVLVFSIVALFAINGALAWFAHNDTVEAEGMAVDVKTTPNLIIGKTEDELKGSKVQFAVSFKDEEASNMIPVTRDESVPDSYLTYLVSPHAVDHTTGNVKDGMSLEFADVPADGNGTYFIDYPVYIASAFDTLWISSLEAQIVMPESVDSDKPYYYAASIDFYVGEVNEDGYRGTTSVAGSLRENNPETVELLRGKAEVPLGTDGYILVIMRCYFDGALQYPSNDKAYINSVTVQTDNIYPIVFNFFVPSPLI